MTWSFLFGLIYSCASATFLFRSMGQFFSVRTIDYSNDYMKELANIQGSLRWTYNHLTNWVFGTCFAHKIKKFFITFLWNIWFYFAVIVNFHNMITIVSFKRTFIKLCNFNLKRNAQFIFLCNPQKSGASRVCITFQKVLTKDKFHWLELITEILSFLKILSARKTTTPLFRYFRVSTRISTKKLDFWHILGL